MRALRRNRLAVGGACLLGLVLGCAAFAPLVAPQDPNLLRPEIRLQPPPEGQDQMILAPAEVELP